MACCSDCATGKTCGSKSLGSAGKYHSGGVTQLQYVGDDVALGTWEDSPFFAAVKLGLLAMGISCLIGVKPTTARWVGIAGIGYGLLRRKG